MFNDKQAESSACFFFFEAFICSIQNNSLPLHRKGQSTDLSRRSPTINRKDILIINSVY